MRSGQLSHAGRRLPALDGRLWFLVLAIGAFAFVIAKDVSLPGPVVLGVGVVGLLGLLFMGPRSPELPLYVMVAYLPFSRQLVGDFGTGAVALNLTNILMIWIFIAHVLRQVGQRERLFERAPLNGVIVFFSLLGAASLIRAGWAYGSWYVWEAVTSLKRWLTPMLLYFLTLWVVRDRRVFKTVVAIIMVAVTVVALMAIRDYLYVSGGSFEKSRVGGVVEHSNTLAAFFVYYMFLFLGFVLQYPRRGRAVWLLIPFLLCFRGIMVTFSRGAYLACAVGGLAACWFRSKVLLLAALALGGLMLINPVLLPAGIRYRMGHTVEGMAEALDPEDLTQSLDKSAASRLEIWQGALQMIRERPWWGMGYGTFPSFIPYYTSGRVGYMDAHNSYLLIAAEMGIPTLLVFLVVLTMVSYYTVWLYRRTQDPAMKSIALGFLAGLAGLWVANLFGSRMDSQEAAGYFWVLSGLVMRGVLLERAATRTPAPAARHIAAAGRPPIPSAAATRVAAGPRVLRGELVRGGGRAS